MPASETDETAEGADVLAENFAAENLPHISSPKRA
jgi:hypothetical protein